MNILIVSLFPLEYNTSVAVSSIGIIRGLLSLGHQITVMMPYEPDSSITLDDDLSSLRIIRIPGRPQLPSSNRMYEKFRNQLTILDHRTRGFLKEARHVTVPNEFFDLVISVSDPKTSHVFTKRLIRRGLKCGRWIQHWGDPISGDISHKCRLPGCIVHSYESHLIRSADKAIYVTPFTYAEIKALYPHLKDRLSFVPLPAEVQSDSTIQTPSKPLRVVYSGAYTGQIRNILPLYEACKQLTDIELTIVGFGVPLEEQDNIRIIPHTTHEKAVQIENDADVLVAICNRRGSQIPGKIFYKSSSQKHILVAVEEYNRNEMYDYLGSYDRYILCDNNVASIKATLAGLIGRHCAYRTPERLQSINIASEILS